MFGQHFVAWILFGFAHNRTDAAVHKVRKRISFKLRIISKTFNFVYPYLFDFFQTAKHKIIPWNKRSALTTYGDAEKKKMNNFNLLEF